MPRLSGTVLDNEEGVGVVTIDPGPPAPKKKPWTKRAAKAFLDSCPTRQVMIARTEDDDRESGEKYHWVGWNGWSYPIKKGELVAVPEPIAQIIDVMQTRFRTAQARERSAELMALTSPEGLEINPGGNS